MAPSNYRAYLSLLPPHHVQKWRAVILSPEAGAGKAAPIECIDKKESKRASERSGEIKALSFSVGKSLGRKAGKSLLLYGSELELGQESERAIQRIHIYNRFVLVKKNVW